MIGHTMYLVRTRAVRKGTDEKIKSCYLMNGQDRTDLERKLRYMVDLNLYTSFAITHVSRVKPNFHLVWSFIEQVKNEPDMIQETNDGSISRYTPTNQAENHNTFAVGVACRLNALDEGHALRKLGKYLIEKNQDTTANVKNPLYDDALIMCEELGSGSLERHAELKNIFKTTRMYSGGAISMGKR